MRGSFRLIVKFFTRHWKFDRSSTRSVTKTSHCSSMEHHGRQFSQSVDSERLQDYASEGLHATLSRRSIRTRVKSECRLKFSIILNKKNVRNKKLNDLAIVIFSWCLMGRTIVSIHCFVSTEHRTVYLANVCAHCERTSPEHRRRVPS